MRRVMPSRRVGLAIGTRLGAPGLSRPRHCTGSRPGWLRKAIRPHETMCVLNVGLVWSGLVCDAPPAACAALRGGGCLEVAKAAAIWLSTGSLL